jgi:hypothetical protein
MKRTFALIIVLIVITIGLVIVALQAQPAKKSATPQTKVTVKPTPEASTVLTLSPDTVYFSASRSASVAVMIDSGYNKLSGVQLEIAYDPLAVTNVRVSPATFFQNPLILLQENDIHTGRISYALAISPSQEPVAGTGTVATISFSKAPGAAGAETMIRLLDKSLVSMLGVQNSVLKQTSDATVMLSPVTQPASAGATLNNGTASGSTTLR